MKIDLAKNISELLYQHETLVFPGFGGIVSGYKSASIDYVQGLLHPPSKELTFNEKLTINDGVLERFVRERYDLSTQEAAQAVGEYVTSIQVSLDKGEIVFFPKVGRLYRNYERKLQFLQDSTNYNTNTFGLPSVQFYPILRSKESLIKEAPVPIQEHKMVGTRTNLAKRLQGAMPMLIGFLVVSIAVALYMIKPDDLFTVENPATMPVSERINKKPTTPNRASILDLDSSETSIFSEKKNEVAEEVTEPSDELEESLVEETIDSESITRAPTQKECIIIVGAFRKKSGVQKTVEAVYELGYDAYKDKKGDLTRVGVQFSYEEEKDIKQVLNRVRKSIHHRAWIFKD